MRTPTTTIAALLLTIPTITNVVVVQARARIHTRQICQDIPNWADSEGTDCSWYAEVPTDDYDYMGDENMCLGYGSCCDNEGHTAETACCVCGGGVNFLETCADYANFLDADGDGCDVYEDLLDDDYSYDDYDTTCYLWGQDPLYAQPGTGILPAEACCVCGGGIPGGKQQITPDPASLAPTVMHVTKGPTSSPVTLAPTSSPSKGPTSLPTKAPVKGPTSSPTSSPTEDPTSSPSAGPTSTPTVSGSAAPSISMAPSDEPSDVPSVSPTDVPSVSPTSGPTVSMAPTDVPTVTPTATPTVSPTQGLSATPSTSPTTMPSIVVTQDPTATPSTSPTTMPSIVVTQDPTATPSTSPTTMPSIVVTQDPTATPSVDPSVAPSVLPSTSPSVAPTVMPSTSRPSVVSSAMPTVYVGGPSSSPSTLPSVTQVVVTTSKPTMMPVTLDPTMMPTSTPTTRMPVTMAPITSAPVTSAPVALTLSTTTEFTMTFDRLNCDAPPLTTAQKVILANITAAFLMDNDNGNVIDDVFRIEALEVVSVTECADAGAARQFIVYGAKDFTMSLTALIGSAATSTSTSTGGDVGGDTRQQQGVGGRLDNVKEYIQSRFNDTESVSLFLSTLRENEELLSTFEMVLSLDVDVQNVEDNVTTASSASPTQSPVATITVAPVLVTDDAPTTNSPPVESSSSSPVVSKATTNAPVAVDTNDNMSSAAATTTTVSMKHDVGMLLRTTCIVASGVATWAMLVL